MSGKQLSVIIPVYNVERYIAKCLRSIVEEGAQALEAVEVIVVDDGSTDKSGRIADAFARKHPCVRVIHQENAGVAAARNAGIRSACGAWLYFVDSDDWLEKGGVRAICEETAKAPDADVLFMEAYQNVGRKQSGWVHFDADTDMADRESITLIFLHATFRAAPITSKLNTISSSTLRCAQNCRWFSMRKSLRYTLSHGAAIGSFFVLRQSGA